VSDDDGMTMSERRHAAVPAHIEARMKSGDPVRYNADVVFQHSEEWTREVEIAALTDLAASVAWKIERLLAKRDEEWL